MISGKYYPHASYLEYSKFSLFHTLYFVFDLLPRGIWPTKSEWSPLDIPNFEIKYDSFTDACRILPNTACDGGPVYPI